MKVAVELCAATLAVSLHHLCGLPPLTGFMGGKRRWAAELADAAFGRGRLDQVIAVDAGPWGDVWMTLTNSAQRARVVARLRELDERGTLKDLWPELVAEAPSDDPARRVAQYLCVQARVTNSLPVWWEPAQSAGMFVMPTKTYETAPWRAAAAQHSSAARGGGMTRVATLAERIERIPPDVYARLHVVHGKVQDVQPIPGAVVLFDPPYRGAPRYAEVLPREEVLDVARAWSKVAARVVVCEGEPLPLDGWQTYRLAAKEWVTAWGLPHAPGAQLNLIAPRFAGDK